MIVKIGENKSQSLTQSTVDGVLFNIYEFAAAVNVGLVAADLVAQEITLKVELRRNKISTMIVQDNLQVLGLFSALQYGINSWYRGNVLVYHDTAVKEAKLTSLFIPFGGPINVKNDDELVIQVLCGRNTFSSNVDGGVSYVEFNPNYVAGAYERATPTVVTQVVQANITKEKFSFGDNVSKISILNFDIDNIGTPVINSLAISSDKLGISLNFFDIINRHYNCLTPPTTQYRFGNTQPVTTGSEALPYLPKYPQSFCLYASPQGENVVLDNCVMDVSFNGGNVNASQNYVCAIRFLSDLKTFKRSLNMESKHQQENLAKIAAASPSAS